MHLSRSAVLVLAVSLSPAAALAEKPDTGVAGRSGRDAGSADGSRWCRTCHEEERHSTAEMRRGAHRKLTCDECHTGYQVDPGEKVEPPPEIDASVLEHRGLRAPEAWASCADCHEDLPGDALGRFPHGKGDPEKGPYCGDCHGDSHTTPRLAKLTDAERRLSMNERCAACHEDPDVVKAAKLTAGMVEGYDHTTHARLLDLGSDRVPGCADCHGGHAMTDLKKGGAEVCKECHDDSTPAFVALANHGPFTPEDRPAGYWMQKGLLWLTFFVILLLSIHVILDVSATVRRTLRGGEPSPPAALERAEKVLQAAGIADPRGRVTRFDRHQRVQHGLLAASFVMLVLTGWPISTHGVGASRALMEFFGGPHGAGLVHRVAGVTLIVAALYHLGYLILLAIRRKPCTTMLPRLQDVRDLIANMAYYLGLRKERARFGRYAYIEKFDYWAVFWGMVMMGGTGLIRWFPDLTARYFPAWLYEGSFVAHADEALLAAMVIFIWHFYNVHLRPAAFPMSKVFLHGRMTLHEMEEEHGAELDALVAKAEASLPQPPPAGEKGQAA